MKEEQQMFKPKILKGMPIHIYNGTGQAWTGGKDLEFVLETEEKRIQTFEKEAHSGQFTLSSRNHPIT